jgi:tetratricopeptide (TPR) repeat protein
VSRWSNRFVSLLSLSGGVLILVAACQSTPREESPPAAHDSVAAKDSEVTRDPGTARDAGVAKDSGAPAPGSTTANNAAAASAAPVPNQAAQQYADALKLMKAGRVRDAEVQFKQLSAAYPQFAGPEVNLGLIYLQDSELPQAESAFKTALERNPANATAGNELGITERRLGKFAAAEAAYQRTIAAEPNYAPAYLNLGVLYDMYLAEPQKALEQFEHYIQLAGENKQVAGWVVELRNRVHSPAPAAKKEPA